MQCPDDSPFIVTVECNETCTTKRHMCVEFCPGSHQYKLESSYMTQCLEECPEFTVKSFLNKTCSTECPVGKPFMFNKTCFDICPKTSPFIIVRTTNYNEIYTCVAFCPTDFIHDGNRCVTSCPTGKHLFNDTCVIECSISYNYLYPKAHIKRTDISHFGRADVMCVDDCNASLLSGRVMYFIHDKKCVTACPSNSQYEFDGKCVNKCPDKFSFEKVEQHGIKCLNICKTLTSNKTCVDKCPKRNPYEYNNACLERCPEEASFMNEILDRTVCTNNCPVMHDVNSSSCVSYCGSPKVVFNNSCLDTCPKDYPLEQSISSRTKNRECVSECKSSTFQYNQTCVFECPADSKYISGMSCVHQCTDELPYKFDKRYKMYWWQSHYNYEYFCVNSCPGDTYVHSNTCVYECPVGFRYLHNTTCHSSCPHDYPYFQNLGNYLHCLSQCPSLSLKMSKKCVDTCSEEEKFKYNGTCSNECSSENLYELLSENPRCVQSCPSNTYIYNNKTCVTKCPLDKKFHYNNTCLHECSYDSIYVYKNISLNTFYCVETCPIGTLYSNMSCVVACAEGSFILNNSCVEGCPHTHSFIHTTKILHVGTFECVKECPKGTFVHNKTCFDKCPDHLSAYNMTCLDECPDALPYRDSRTGNCVNKCKDDLVLYHGRFCETKCKNDTPYLESKLCVQHCSYLPAVHENSSRGIICHTSCPHEMILDFDSNFCIDKCWGDALIIDNICTTALKCPPDKYITQTKRGRECKTCPSDFYIDGQRCVKYCSAAQAMIGRVCTSFDCPSTHPLRLFETEDDLRALFHKLNQSSDKLNESLLTAFRKTCYKECPENYVANDSHCILELICYSWDFVTYNKRCFQSCPEESIKYYLKCHPIKAYYIITGLCGITLLTAMMFLYCLVWFKGYSRMAFSYCRACSKNRMRNRHTESNGYEFFSNDLCSIEKSNEETTV